MQNALPDGESYMILMQKFTSASKSCIIRPREVHSVAVAAHFPIYLGLGSDGLHTFMHSRMLYSGLSARQ